MRSFKIYPSASLTVILAVVSVSFLAFCILSDSSGNPRIYLDSDIPFVYRLHISTSPDFIPSIDQGAQVWEDVVSSYWEFERGQPTTVSGPGEDGVNLVFFDTQGINFDPNTNVIAFSRTFTQGVGVNYRAVESDLVWNARDYPPSPTGAPGQQDLMSVIAHEFGHHLGLGHTGLPSGADAGCGVQIPAATMWAFSSPGDTTKRTLHIDDSAGISFLYPVWAINGAITDASTGSPLENAEVEFIGSTGSTGGVVTSAGSTFGLPGDAVSRLVTDTSGTFSGVVLNQNFTVMVEAFGYSPVFRGISFDPPAGVGQTQVQPLNVTLQRNPLALLQGTVRDSLSGNPIAATLEFWGIGDLSGNARGVVTTQPDGSYSVMLPSGEAYDVIVKPVLPYPDGVSVNNVSLSASGFALDFDLKPTSVLIVDDDGGELYEDFYQESLDGLGVPRRTWSVDQEGGTPTPQQLSLFAFPRTLVWFTGSDTTNALTASERTLLIDHLESGGTLLLTGQNIAQFSAPDDFLLSRHLGVSFATTFALPFIKGIAGDVIGNGLSINATGGAGNQTSKDQLSLSADPTGKVSKVFYYGFSSADTAKIAGVRVEHVAPAWRAVFLGFGLEGLGNLSVRNTIIDRSLNWLAGGTVTGVEPVLLSELPREFRLHQNYPNPFNPSTVIAFDLPRDSHVTLKLYNPLGQEVIMLVDEEYKAGSYRVEVNLTSLASGVYLYRLTAGTFTSTKKMLLLK